MSLSLMPLECVVKGVKRVAKVVEKNQKIKYVAICFATALILTSGNLLYFSDISSSDDQFFSHLDEKSHRANVQRFRDCLVGSNQLWDQLREIVRECNMRHTKIRSQFTLVLPRGTQGEVKVFLPYRNKPETSEPDSSGCTSLTIGIGNEITAEQHFLARYPKCQLYGADPIVDGGESFIRIGTYFPLAIGDKPLKVSNGSHLFSVKSVRFRELLQTYMKVSAVDFVSVDVNDHSDEMKILSELNSISPVLLCQIEVKFYRSRWPSEETFDRFLRNFLLTSDYIVIAAGHQLSQTRRVTMVNWRERICVRKFELDYLLSPPETI